MNHISLFSGIGGFDLAAQWMGWNNIAHVEQKEFCLKILNHYWPHAKTHTDICTTDFTVYRGQCDIITGGFPCQPFSTAGKLNVQTIDIMFHGPSKYQTSVFKIGEVYFLLMPITGNDADDVLNIECTK